MRRRRKTRYTWLPIQNGTTFTAGQGYDRSVQTFALDIQPDGSNAIGIIPVVADAPQGTLTTVEDEGIGEIIGNEYVLKRIVGKIHLSLTQQNTSNDTTVSLNAFAQAAVNVSCGFFVARSDINNALIPAGANETDGERLYSPQNAELTRQPWIWRRTWILGAGIQNPTFDDLTAGGISANGSINGLGKWPPTNAAYGSVQDGPHIDAKTGRRIRLEERLWFVASGHTVDAAGVNANINSEILVQLDCRYLGALRRARARSNFA